MKRINWTAALSKPVEKITEAESVLLLEAAGDWALCACGNHCRKLPRQADGEPKDKILSRHGMDFYNAVSHLGYAVSRLEFVSARDIQSRALSIHNKIERRAAKLLAKMEGKV